MIVFSKSVLCRETLGTARSNGWRVKAKKEKERLRKRKERKRKTHPHGGGAPGEHRKGVNNRGRIRSAKSKRLLRKDAVRHYTIHRAPGVPLQYHHREILQKDWNDRIEHGKMPTLRMFARDHGIPVQTWKREYERGALGVTVPDPKRPGRKIYALYDAGKAQDKINEGYANKGAPMKVTNKLNAAFTKLVKEMKLSPYDAVCRMKEDKELEGSAIPCVRTWYNHIKSGDISVHYGETPNHPDKKRKKGPKPHPAKTVLGRLQLQDRPIEAKERSELGHLEMDTIVSSMNGSGGLLVLLDRYSRKYYIEKINEISQRAIIKALKRLKKRQGWQQAKSITTDNGCEFLNPDAIKEVVGCNIYYTRAYASYEKGSVENCNRLVRRWYPKGTDFSLCSRGDICKLEEIINGIHRLALGGKPAAQFHAELAMTA